MRKLTSVFILSVFVICLFTAHAHACNKGKGKHHAWPAELLTQLGLSAEQTASLEEIKATKDSKMATLKEKKHTLKEKLHKAMAEEGSEGKLRSMHKRIDRVKSKMGNARFDSYMAMRKTLGTEKWKQFIDLKMTKYEKTGCPHKAKGESCSGCDKCKKDGCGADGKSCTHKKSGKY